jgi:hypothetical protein
MGLTSEGLRMELEMEQLKEMGPVEMEPETDGDDADADEAAVKKVGIEDGTGDWPGGRYAGGTKDDTVAVDTGNEDEALPEEVEGANKKDDAEILLTVTSNDAAADGAVVLGARTADADGAGEDENAGGLVGVVRPVVLVLSVVFGARAETMGLSTRKGLRMRRSGGRDSCVLNVVGVNREVLENGNSSNNKATNINPYTTKGLSILSRKDKWRVGGSVVITGQSGSSKGSFWCCHPRIA